MKGILAIVFIVTLGVVTLGAAPVTPLQGYNDAPVVLLGLPEILGPQTVVMGELARLEVEGDKVAWDCVPTINDGQAYDNKFVCSFRKRGLYTIVAAVYRNDDVLIMKFPIQVGVTTPSPDDEPEEPEDPIKIEVSADPALIKEVVKWCKTTKSNKAQCQLVASVFEVVAGEIEKGDLSSTAEIIERTAELNQNIEINELASLLGRIQAYLTQEADAGRLDSVEEHLIVWKSIALGLMEYTK